MTDVASSGSSGYGRVAAATGFFFRQAQAVLLSASFCYNEAELRYGKERKKKRWNSSA
jgi:hypothetical protein